MALKGCYSCIKYLLFAFNFIFWLIGLALLSIGIWIKVNSKSLDDATRELKSSKLNEVVARMHMTLASDYIYILLIVISILIITIGFLGCCGACKESQCLLGLFFICLLVIFSVIIGVGVFAFASEGKPKELLTKAINKQIELEKSGDTSAGAFMKSLQDTFKCCGSDAEVADHGSKLPSCDVSNYSKPCVQAIITAAKDNDKLIGGILIGISFVLLMGLLFSIMLCCAIREQQAD